MTSTKPIEQILEVLGNWGAFSGVRWSVQPQTPKHQLSMSLIVPGKGLFDCWDTPILDITLSGQRLLLGYPCCNSLSFFSLLTCLQLVTPQRLETLIYQYVNMRNFPCSGKLACRNSEMCRLVHMLNGQIPCWVASVPFGGQLLGTWSSARGKQQSVEELLSCPPPNKVWAWASSPMSTVRVKEQDHSKGVGGRLGSCC